MSNQNKIKTKSTKTSEQTTTDEPTSQHITNPPNKDPALKKSLSSQAAADYSTSYPIETVLDILNVQYPYHPMADVTRQEPFKVLICCLLTLRSRDVVTIPTCGQLFKLIDTPQQLLDLPEETLAECIRPVQFYRNKVKILRHVCQELIERFDGQVPDTLEALKSIKGVGLKTANLVLALGFQKPAIAVDTHVHRISNRLGYVKTRTPEETEAVLKRVLPRHYWSMINRVMVRHGQEICIAGRPRCDVCPVFQYCRRVGVTPRAVHMPLKASHAIFTAPQDAPHTISNFVSANPNR